MTDCTICIEKIDESQHYMQLKPCNHNFHDNCIHMYFANQGNAANKICPNCRGEVKKIKKISAKKKRATKDTIQRNIKKTKRSPIEKLQNQITKLTDEINKKDEERIKLIVELSVKEEEYIKEFGIKFSDDSAE